MKNKTLEELIKEYRTEVKWRINPKMEAFIKKVYEAGGEAERENLIQEYKYLEHEAGWACNMSEGADSGACNDARLYQAIVTELSKST